MKRYRPLAFFGVALVLGLVTSVLVFTWLQNPTDHKDHCPQIAGPHSLIHCLHHHTSITPRTCIPYGHHL